MFVIVTGGSKGIGKAIVKVFAKQGNTIAFCGRNKTDIDIALKELNSNYSQCIFHGCVADLSVKADIEIFSNYCNQIAHADVLVNNAGIFTPGNIHSEEEGLLENLLNTNLLSAYHFTRKILPQMMEQKKGYIFNICSIAALQAYANGGSYSISKFALLGFSKNLREEMKPFNIKVSAVHPGAVLTNSWAGFDNSDNRIMIDEDVAQMIYAATQLSDAAVVEDIVLRPQLGDL